MNEARAVFAQLLSPGTLAIPAPAKATMQTSPQKNNLESGKYREKN